MQVVEAPAEVRERGLGVARLPGPDDAFTGAGDQPDRAVGVDAAEPVRIARRRVRRPSAPAGRGAGRDAAVLAAGAGLGGGGLCPSWLAGRHIRYLVPSARRSAHLPRDAAPDSCHFARYSNRSPRACRTPFAMHLPTLVTNDDGRSPMDKADIAALLALGAAFFIAIGDVMHQRRRTRSPTNRSATSPCSLRLLRDRQWWLGSLVAARRIRAAGRGARLRLGAAGAGAAGHLAAVRAADQRAADRTGG